MNKAETIKQLLRNKSCENCDNRYMSEEETQAYRLRWNEEPPFDWCRVLVSRPKENTCPNWGDFMESDNLYSYTLDENGEIDLSDLEDIFC